MVPKHRIYGPATAKPRVRYDVATSTSSWPRSGSVVMCLNILEARFTQAYLQLLMLSSRIEDFDQDRNLEVL